MMEKITHASLSAHVQSSIHWVGVLSLTAGVIHGIASTSFWGAWWGYAAFFLMVAVAQVAAGLIVLIQPWRYDNTGGIREADSRYARPFFLVGIVFNAGLIGIWLLSQVVLLALQPDAALTTGLIIGLGALASLIEVIIVVYLVRWVRMIDRLSRQDANRLAVGGGTQ